MTERDHRIIETCAHPSEATLMFGERECLTCGRVALPTRGYVCPRCEASSTRPGDNQHCVYDGSLHAWHNSARTAARTAAKLNGSRDGYSAPPASL